VTILPNLRAPTRAGRKRGRPALRLRHPQTTVRWRLTLLYGGLFLISGAALLAITYTLVERDPLTNSAPSFIRAAVNAQAVHPGTFTSPAPKRPPSSQPTQRLARQSHVPPLGYTFVPPPVRKLLGSINGRRAIVTVGSQQRLSDMHQLIVESSIALAIMALISTLLGWLVAGRVLRPLRTMTATTQQISEANLNRRLALDGPRDELRELADTIDGLLERLEGAFDAQRRFVANASHELRTPLTAARALLEMVLTDPNATVDTYRTACRQVLEESEQQEQLIDALLALAQGQRGIDRREPIDLAAIVREALDINEAEARARGIEIRAALQPTVLSGDRRLVGRLASNLVENAIRHNIPEGNVRVWVESVGGWATLVISNTGPAVSVGEIERLLQPFQRLTRERTGQGDGFGLGLSIVAAIADAHNASLDVRPASSGGLRVEVRFPAASGAEAQLPAGEDRPLLVAGPLELAGGPVQIARR
jgi:signal transduction histidine kinase